MYTYVLKSIKYDWHYVGISNNVDRRFIEHNNGWVNKTKFYKPFVLVHVELAENRQDARKFEEYFKSGYGRELIKEIEENLTV